MFPPLVWARLTFSTALATIGMLSHFSLVTSGSVVKPEAVSQASALPLPNRDPRLLSTTQPEATQANSILQGTHYIRNTYLRSNLIEKQPGIPLSLTFVITDKKSCSPVENALVELWGANSQGLYSGYNTNGEAPSECSSWLRGAVETDTDGVAKFETIYPGEEEGRALHLQAIIRTDWFEHSSNHTVDADTSHTAAAIGQVFFPDSLNKQVLGTPDYNSTATHTTTNEEDPVYSSGSGVWKVKTNVNTNKVVKSVKAQVSITVDAHAPQGVMIMDAPCQCKSESGDYRNSSEPVDTTSAANSPKPTGFWAAPCTFIFLYGLQQLVLYNGGLESNH